MPARPPIRHIAICVFRRGSRILVARGTDDVKRESFYRPLGGEIEFGETAVDALRRENTHGGCLTGPIRSDEAKDIARREIQFDRLNREQVTVFFCQLVCSDHRRQLLEAPWCRAFSAVKRAADNCLTGRTKR